MLILIARSLHRLRSDHKGVAAVEFALCFPLLLLIVFGIFEMGRVYWIKNNIQTATDTAGRFLMMNPDASNSDIQTQIVSNITTFNPTGLSVNITDTANGNGVAFKTMNVTFPYAPLQGYIPVTTTLTIQSTVPVIP